MFRGELDLGMVDIGWKDLYAHFVGFRNEDSQFVRVIHFVGQQSCNEFDGVVGF